MTASPHNQTLMIPSQTHNKIERQTTTPKITATDKASTTTAMTSSVVVVQSHPSLIHKAPSKQLLHSLAAELNDFGALHHQNGNFEDALLRYQEAVHMRMKALKVENGDVAALAGLSEPVIRERFEAVRCKKEEMAYSITSSSSSAATEINKPRRLDMYHKSETRIACETRNIVIVKPIHSGTHVFGTKDSKYFESSITLYNMGLVHQESNSLSKATQLFCMALRVVPRTSHPSLAALIFYSLAQVSYESGDLGRAARELSESIQLYSVAASSGASLSDVDTELNFASALSLLGQIHYDSKDLGRAVELCREALRIRRSILGDNHIDTAASFYNLGLVVGEGNYSESLQESIKLVVFALQVLKTRSKPSCLGGGVVCLSQIVTVLRTLGALYLQANSVANAIKSISKALELARNIASQRPTELTKLTDVADALFALGRIYHEQGQRDAALTQYHEALRIERMIGEEHEEMASVLCSLGQIYHELGDLDLALDFQEQVLQMSRRLLGDDSEFVADLLTIIGNIQSERGNTQDAMARFTEAERIMVRIRQVRNAASNPPTISLMSLSGTEGAGQQSSPAIVTNLLQSFGIEFHPAAAAA